MPDCISRFEGTSSHTQDVIEHLTVASAPGQLAKSLLPGIATKKWLRGRTICPPEPLSKTLFKLWTVPKFVFGQLVILFLFRSIHVGSLPYRITFTRKGSSDFNERVHGEGAITVEEQRYSSSLEVIRFFPHLKNPLILQIDLNEPQVLKSLLRKEGHLTAPGKA